MLSCEISSLSPAAKLHIVIRAVAAESEQHNCSSLCHVEIHIRQAQVPRSELLREKLCDRIGCSRGGKTQNQQGLGLKRRVHTECSAVGRHWG